MTARTPATLALLVGLIVGCSSTPPQKPAPVDVNGTVTLPNGQPAKDVTISFFPTTNEQIQGNAKIGADGKFSLKMNPGKYTFGFEGRSIKTLPEKYHSNRAEHAVEIPASGVTDLAIKLTD